MFMRTGGVRDTHPRFKYGAMWAFALCSVASPSLTGATDIEWVGPQSPNVIPEEFIFSSFHHAGNWRNFLVPGATDKAIFDIGVDRTGLPGITLPQTVVFGDHTVRVTAGNDVFVAGQDALVRTVEINNGTFMFDLDGQRLTTFSGIVDGANLDVVGGGEWQVVATQIGRNDDANLTVRGGSSLMQTFSNPFNALGELRVGGGTSFGSLLISGSGSSMTSDLGINGLRNSVISVEAGASAAVSATNITDRFVLDGPTTSFTGESLKINPDTEPLGGFSVPLPGSSLLFRNGFSAGANDIGFTGAATIRNGAQVILDDKSGLAGVVATVEIGGGDEGVNGRLNIETDASLDVAGFGHMIVGGRGTGAVNINSGGQASAREVWIAVEPGSVGVVAVDGRDSRINASNIYVGHDIDGGGGAATMTAGNNSLVDVDVELVIGAGSSVVVDPGGQVNVGFSTLFTGNPGDVEYRDFRSSRVFDSPVVLTNGTVTGNGEIVGDLVAAGGTVAPGASIGSLRVTDDLFLGETLVGFTDTGSFVPYNVFLDGATTLIEIETTNNFDTIIVGGDAILGGFLDLEFADDFQPSEPTTLDIFYVNGDISGAFRGIRSSRDDIPFLISNDGTTLSITFVPEPASLSVLAIAGGILIRSRPSCHSRRWSSRRDR